HFHLDQLVVTRAPDGDLNRRAARPAQLGHRLVAGPAFGVFAADFGDDVAAPNALLVGGRSFEQRHDRDVAVDDVDADAEAVVMPFLPFTQRGIRLRVHEARMRIERLEHAVY